MVLEGQRMLLFCFFFSPQALIHKPEKMQAPTGLQSDVTIELPAEDVEKSSGISIDIGKARLIYCYNF